jgi:hypothetical protein
MHPDYFKTRFYVFDDVVEWPEEFVIISAHATTGEQWTREQNEHADEDLYEVLDRLNVWWESVTGHALDTGHSESSYAAQLPLDVGRELGRRFRQDAIFHVRGDLLSVTHCDNRGELVPIGSFRERVDVFDSDAAYWRLSQEPDSPWRLLTSENLAAVLDRNLRVDPGSSLPVGEVFVPVAELSLYRALVAAMPDEATRRAAQDDLDAGGDVDIKRLSHTFPEIRDGGWVVQCEVTSSMASGVWGLIQFTIADRGYLCCQPDSEGREDWSPVLAGAWSPADNAQALRACIHSAYTRLWDSEGFPPLLGEWVTGDPETLHAGILSALETDKGRSYWSEVLAHIREAELTDLPIASCLRVGAMSGVPSPWIERTARLLADPLSGLTEQASAGGAHDEERQALAALYLASVMRESREALDRSVGQWLGPVEELLGTWHIGYGDENGMVSGEVEATVTLRPDGSFTWDPPPNWLGPSGEWGLEALENGAHKLRFEEGGVRWSNYVVMHYPKGYGTFFNWQRSRWDAIVFKDRILRGYLAQEWARDMPDDS